MTTMDRNNRDGGNRKPTIRDTIITALDTLENENDQLKTLNTKITSELSVLERENERLRNELQQMRNERNGMRNRVDKLDSTNGELHQEIQQLTSQLSEGHRCLEETKTQWYEERSIQNKQLEDLRNLITQREEAKKRTEREVEALRNRLERTARKNYNDRDIELLHEVEMLKEEKNDLAGDLEELNKVNKKLKTELNNLEISLDEKDAELKNEGRRHSLLTKEFNSLLDENNRLKLQLKRKSTQSLNRFVSRSSEKLQESVTLSEFHPNGSTHELTNQGQGQTTSRGGVGMTSSQRQHQHPHSSTQVPGGASTAREPSLIINNEVFQPSREYPFSSSTSRQVSRMPSMTSREPSLVKRGGSFSVRDGKKGGLGGRPTAARFDDRTTPDTLPTLGPTGTSAKGNKTSK